MCRLDGLFLKYLQLFGDDEHRFVFGELKFPEFLLRQLDLDRRSPLAERLDLHHGASGIDVLDDGAKVAAAIGLALNLQQVRAHVDQVSRGGIVDSWGFLVNPAVEQVHIAEEVVNERRERVMVDIVRAADLLDAAFVHHRDAIGDFERFLLIVGDEHAGDVNLVMQLAQPTAQFEPDLRVQRAERFVEQQDAGFNGQGARQRDPLALASGELRGIPAGQILQLDQTQAVRGPWRGSALSMGAHFADEL